MLGFLLRRRSVLRLPLSVVGAYVLSAILGPTAGAAEVRVWRVNASNYATGIRRLFDEIVKSAKAGGSFPISALMANLPLNPTAPDASERLAQRPNVLFDAQTATAVGSYDSLDFEDAAIGAVTIILPTRMTAKYSFDGTEVRFDFEGADEQLTQVVIWNIPGNLMMPKSLRVKALYFKGNGTRAVLSNTVNANLLELHLDALPPTTKVTLASSDRLTVAEAFLLLAQNTSVSCGPAPPTSGGSEYERCVEQVKREYPVPNGNINVQNQMIEQRCKDKKK